jgi:hypothetical protein
MTGREADIVEGLRHHVAEAETDAVPARSLWRCVPVSELREAADIIERLSQENEGLRTAADELRETLTDLVNAVNGAGPLCIPDAMSSAVEVLRAADSVPVQTEK